MFWQRELLRDQVAMTFAQTWEFDLPKSGQLGSLLLYLRSAQNGYPFLGAVHKWRLVDYISKIEVIADGSEVIKSLEGKEALAAAFYDDFRLPFSMWRAYSNSWERQWVPLNFGRWLKDELYGLDLSKYNQCSLKITNDATSTQYTTAITLDVIAFWLRDALGPFAGHFREEVWKAWTPAAAAIEYSELPVALPIRRILLEAVPPAVSTTCKNSAYMRDLMSDIDLTFKTGQLRVFKGSMEVLGALSTMEMPAMVDVRGAIDRTAGLGFDVGVGYVMQNMGAWGVDADNIATVLGNMHGDIQESAQEMGYRSANGMLAWDVRGYGYMHCVPLWYARKPDLDDMLDPAAQAVVKVDITCKTGTTVTGTAHDARNAIILSRLVR